MGKNNQYFLSLCIYDAIVLLLKFSKLGSKSENRFFAIISLVFSVTNTEEYAVVRMMEILPGKCLSIMKGIP